MTINNTRTWVATVSSILSVLLLLSGAPEWMIAQAVDDRYWLRKELPAQHALQDVVAAIENLDERVAGNTKWTLISRLAEIETSIQIRERMSNPAPEHIKKTEELKIQRDEMRRALEAINGRIPPAR